MVCIRRVTGRVARAPTNLRRRAGQRRCHQCHLPRQPHRAASVRYRGDADREGDGLACEAFRVEGGRRQCRCFIFALYAAGRRRRCGRRFITSSIDSRIRPSSFLSHSAYFVYFTPSRPASSSCLPTLFPLFLLSVHVHLAYELTIEARRASTVSVLRNSQHSLLVAQRGGGLSHCLLSLHLQAIQGTRLICGVGFTFQQQHGPHFAVQL